VEVDEKKFLKRLFIWSGVFALYAGFLYWFIHQLEHLLGGEVE